MQPSYTLPFYLPNRISFLRKMKVPEDRIDQMLLEVLFLLMTTDKQVVGAYDLSEENKDWLTGEICTRWHMQELKSLIKCRKELSDV